MTIQSYFQPEVVEAAQVFLDEHEEAELDEYIEVLLSLSKQESGELDPDACKNIMMMSFLAGRVYQSDRQDEASGAVIEEEVVESDDIDYLNLRIHKTAASRLLELLLNGE